MDTALATAQIEALRDMGDVMVSAIDTDRPDNDPSNEFFRKNATRFRAAANLLEVHEATGISLEQFGEVGDFVNDMLEEVHQPPFEPNGV